MGRKGYHTLRGSTQIPRLSRFEEKRALVTCNGVKAYTLLALCRLARGIRFLLVGALAAAGASSLGISGKGHVSHMRRMF